MTQLKRILSLSLGLGVLSTTAVLMTAGTVSAQNVGFNASCFTGDVDPDFGQASCVLLTIPPGRQVVIESISCQAVLVAGQGPGDVQLIVPNPPPFVGGPPQGESHLLTLSKQAGNSTLDIWRMTTPLRAYASAPAGGSVGIGLFFRAFPSPSVSQGIGCTISGFSVGP